MKLTQQDGEAIRAALVAWLKTSQLADRDELLTLTERATVWESSRAADIPSVPENGSIERGSDASGHVRE